MLKTPQHYRNIRYLGKPLAPDLYRGQASPQAAAGTEEGEIHWVEQNAATRSFRFRVGFDADLSTAVAIEVLDRATGKRVQRIRGFDSFAKPADDPKDALELVDANFDGYPDLSILLSSGLTGYSDNIFLFDPRSRSFRYDPQLSNIINITIDAKSRTINSSWVDGCCSLGAKTWRYIHGKLTEVASWEEARPDNDLVITTTCRRIANRERCRTVRKKASGE